MTLRQFDRMDPNERSYWIAEWVTVKSECPDCGRPADECADHERLFYPQRRVCYPTMEREAASAQYAELHAERPFHDGTFTSWAKDRSNTHPYHFTDGVRIQVADFDATPWDKFTTAEIASPVQSVAEQAQREQH